MLDARLRPDLCSTSPGRASDSRPPKSRFPAWLGPSLVQLLLASAVGLGAVGMATADDGRATGPRSVAEIRAEGQLVLLTFPHQESVFSRTNLELGAMPKLGKADHFVGVDIDLARAVADHLGVELMVRPVSEPRYSALLPDLLAGRGDLVASSYSITPERQERLAFSRPYFTVFPVIVTQADGAGEGNTVARFEDLEGQIAAVTAGSSHEQRLLSMGFPAASILHVDFSFEAYAAIVEGRADFTLADSTSAYRILDQTPQLQAAFRLDDEDHYAVAVPPGSELLPLLDQVLHQLESSGELDRILARHGIVSAADQQ